MIYLADFRAQVTKNLENTDMSIPEKMSKSKVFMPRVDEECSA